ncbi:hypothetical protein FDO65_01950 [Nakamurella flava]|uniref:RNA polymerase sigma-70 region 2 domain-containing protein n=1 Tax=Nakamurella flava TaxID=2576308 RepID=A0A4V6CS73_9ACTN|nr:hypothetical protein [Nakamurella flava]TKV60495.1 hypothetical protein FDO65_01950 [Nakamurella flava]
MSVSIRATVHPRTDGHLWRALLEARRDGRRLTAAHVEDALFRHHLPMARKLVDRYAGRPGASQRRTLDAAEIALSRAILRWSPGRDEAFTPWAAARIGEQLDQMVATEPPSTR